jgi:uncharacterized protein (TIGR00369 family)
MLPVPAPFQSANPDYKARIVRELGAQGVCPLFEIVIDEQSAGRVVLSMPITPQCVQQYQVVHGGIVTMLADSASGLAGISLLPAQDGVLSIEFKINLLGPGRGQRMIARGEVIKAGRTVIVSKADVYCVDNGVETHTAILTNTLLVAKGIAARVK